MNLNKSRWHGDTPRRCNLRTTGRPTNGQEGQVREEVGCGDAPNLTKLANLVRYSLNHFFLCFPGWFNDPVRRGGNTRLLLPGGITQFPGIWRGNSSLLKTILSVLCVLSCWPWIIVIATSLVQVIMLSSSPLFLSFIQLQIIISICGASWWLLLFT